MKGWFWSCFSRVTACHLLSDSSVWSSSNTPPPPPRNQLDTHSLSRTHTRVRISWKRCRAAFLLHGLTCVFQQKTQKLFSTNNSSPQNTMDFSSPSPPPPQLPTPVRSAWPSAENQIYIYILKCGSVGNENDFSVSVFHTKNSRLALAAEAFKPNKPKPTFVIPVPAVQPEEMRPAHLDSAELETFSQTTGGDM